MTGSAIGDRGKKCFGWRNKESRFLSRKRGIPQPLRMGNLGGKAQNKTRERSPGSMYNKGGGEGKTECKTGPAKIVWGCWGEGNACSKGS